MNNHPKSQNIIDSFEDNQELANSTTESENNMTDENQAIQSYNSTNAINIDDDLTYLYGQLPERIRSAAVAVMTKKIRKVTYNLSRAFLNFFGFVLG